MTTEKHPCGVISGVAGFVRSIAATCPGPVRLLAEHGRNWKPAPLPKDVRSGIKQGCFHNCATLALRWQRFIYCEGYACGVIPVLHAWLLDAQGNVIDPTWTGGRNMAEPGIDYFGVAIKTKYLIERTAMLQRGPFVASILDDWINDYPILSAPIDDWKHPINNQQPTTTPNT